MMGWSDRVKGKSKTSDVPQNQACVNNNPTRDFASDLPATILTCSAAQLFSDWL